MNRTQFMLKKNVFCSMLNREKYLKNKNKINIWQANGVVKRKFHSYFNPQNGGDGDPHWWLTILAIASVYFVHKITGKRW